MFQKYHSIHARGEDVAEVLRDAADAAAATSTEHDDGQKTGSRELSEEGEIDSDLVVDGDGDDDEQRNGDAMMTEEPTPAPVSVPVPFPQGMIGQCKFGSVPD